MREKENYNRFRILRGRMLNFLSRFFLICRVIEVDLFRHWIPSLRQSKTKYVYLAQSCYFCNEYRLGRNNSFRINIKLKVWKCYKCGLGGKDFNMFKHYIKIYKIKGKRPLSIAFEHKIGVEY